MKKSNKGVTLVELVIVLALLTFGIGIAVNMILFSRNAQAKTLEEFDFQSEMRQSSQVVNNEIRNSTVVFAVPQDTFNNKKAMWNYLGLEDSKTLVQYTWNEADSRHDRIELYKSDQDISLNLMFKQLTPNSKLIEFTLQGYIDGKTDPKMTIKSEIEAFNSVVVEDGGSPSYPATALAYRTDDTPGPQTKAGKKVVAAITLVLDESGSMANNMSGGRVTSSNPSRISILRNRAKALIDQFSGLGNIYVGIIPYSDDAYVSGTKSFVLADGTNVNTIKNKIDSLTAQGMTNTGDAMRISYYATKQFKDSPNSIDNTLPTDTKVIPYMILLSDGDPTVFSATTREWVGWWIFGHYEYSGYKQDSGYVISDRISDDSESKNTSQWSSMGYSEYIGQNLVVGGDLEIKSHVIGFSNDATNAQTIANYINAEYHSANSDVELEAVFDEIGGTILKEMWHIYGPYAEDENNN